MAFLKFANASVLEVAVARPHGGLMKDAHRHTFNYKPRTGYIYVRSRAISSRTNDNFDTFPADEIRKSWLTFVGKPVFVNHHNDDIRRKRGVIIDAVLHEDTAPDGTEDVWIEVLMEIDAVRFPLLAEAILSGDIERTSMGCDVAESECSVCGTVARTPNQYCAHVSRMKGQRIRRRSASTDEVEDVLVHEICRGISFFENSLLVEPPADPTAIAFGVDARGLASLPEFAHVLPKKAVANQANDRWRDAELGSDVRQGDLPPAGSPLAPRRASGQPTDLDHVGLGQLGGGVPHAASTAATADHVGRVLSEGAEHPVGGVVAQRLIAGVADDETIRYWADKGFVAPAVRAHAAAAGIIQRQASVAVGEGPSRPGPAGIRTARGIDLGEVPLHDRLGALEFPADHLGYFTAAAQYTMVSGGPDNAFELHVAGCADLSRPKYTLTNRLTFDASSVDDAVDIFLDEELRDQGWSEIDIKIFPCARSGVSAPPKAIDPNACPATGTPIVNPRRRLRLGCPECGKVLGTGRGVWPKHAPLKREGQMTANNLAVTSVNQEAADSIVNAFPESLRPRAEKLKHRLVYGPSYDRNITENMSDALRFANRGEMDSAEYFMRKCEAKDVFLNGGEFIPAMHPGNPGQQQQMFASRKQAGGTWDYGPTTPGRNAGTRWEDILTLPNPRAHVVIVRWPGDEVTMTSGVFGDEERADEWAQMCLEAGAQSVHVTHSGKWRKVAQQKLPLGVDVVVSSPSETYHTTGCPNCGSQFFSVVGVGPYVCHDCGTKYDGESRLASRKTAFGETTVPPKIDTLRLPECPVCGEDADWDGTGRCRMCGYIPPPEPFRDPDLEVAQRVDVTKGWINPELAKAPPFEAPT